ncbi:MAG: GNAT family N-acetyltransferase [Algicola sp.]|nr:GNAT family N-acetyltransferase [Algicola sp.]
MTIKTGETERLILRQFEDRDLQEYAAMLSDSEVVQFLGNGKALTREEAWRSMAMNLGHWQLRGFGLWAVLEKASGRLVGRVGLFYPDGWPDIEIGWMLNRAFWGKGYAIECAQHAVDCAFNELGLKRVVSVIHPQNLASIKLAEKLGMNCQGESDIDIDGTLALLYCLEKSAPL